MRVNAMTEQFEDVTVLGHPMIFTCLRVDRDTVPEGLYMLNLDKRENEIVDGERAEEEPSRSSDDRER